MSRMLSTGNICIKGTDSYSKYHYTGKHNYGTINLVSVVNFTAIGAGRNAMAVLIAYFISESISTIFCNKICKKN